MEGAGPPSAGLAGSGGPAWAAGATAGGTVPPAPLGFPFLLDEAMRWTRRYLRTIYPPIAVPAAVLSAGFAAVQILWQRSQPTAIVDPWQALARLYSLLAVSAPFLLLLGLLQAAMVVAALDAVSGRPVAAGRALRFVVRPAVLGTQALVLLCVAASLVLCCAVPAIYVWPLLAMTLPAMADEGVTGPEALRRSVQLTRHNPRRRLVTSPIVKILALALVTVTMSMLATMVLQLPVAVVQAVVLVRKLAGGEDVPTWSVGFNWLMVPLRALSSLVVSVVSLYSSFAMALLFRDLRARREGGDLWQAVVAMAGPRP